MATKKMVVITAIDNKDYVLEKANEYGVAVHRYYETVGTTDVGNYEAMAFVVSGEACGDFVCDLADLECFGM